MTWSDTPFTAETGVGDQPILIIGPEGRPVAPSQIFIGKTKSTAEVELTQPGTYRVQAVDPLTYWTRVSNETVSLVACQLEREVTDDPKADIHSFNAYLTLFVQPPAK